MWIFMFIRRALLVIFMIICGRILQIAIRISTELDWEKLLQLLYISVFPITKTETPQNDSLESSETFTLQETSETKLNKTPVKPTGKFKQQFADETLICSSSIKEYYYTQKQLRKDAHKNCTSRKSRIRFETPDYPYISLNMTV